LGRPSGSFWAAAAGACVAVVAAYFFVASRQLERRKSDLLSKQRAVARELGPRWSPLEALVERTVAEAAGPWPGDRVDPSLAEFDVRSAPGVYLRARRKDVEGLASQEAAAVAEGVRPRTLRDVAERSLRDGFVACFARATEGSALHDPVEGATGDGGVFLEQPWNLRQAYAATRVLSPLWLKEVRGASDDLRLRIFEEQFDKAATRELPAAVDIVTRAKTFLLLLDEEPEGPTLADEAELQRVEHTVRVVLVDVRGGVVKLRARPRASARIVPAGESVVRDPETRAAMERQANNCALAQAVIGSLPTARLGASSR
jgi:hypothetical protein